MNIQISWLVIGALVAGNSSAAQAVAMKPLDPDQAPIAAVDRFSDCRPTASWDEGRGARGRRGDDTARVDSKP